MIPRFIVPFAVSLFASTLCALPVASQADVIRPEEHLGRALGADFELADWSEVSGYFHALDADSERVLVEEVGTTTEGRKFLLATVSSQANLSNLDALRSAARRIADPRGLAAEEREALLASAKPILFISIGMHSTETAAPQFGMELAYRLATSDEEVYRRAREELVILIAPCLNPDGLDHVVSWYRETVGTPFEASSLLKLYQFYAGHDNNRDWFMLSQAETRIVTSLLYSRWFPQVYWDVHQQGSSRERFFVPPYRDPLNPNLDPGIIAGIGELGGRALFDMTRAGFSGVSTGITYDMWWNGGNRNVPVRHNVIGILTEAASVNIASPIFLPRSDLSAPSGLGGYAPSNRFPDPWPGGWWRLRDIIEYEHAFSRSLLGNLAREPRLWLENALSAAERSIAAGQEDAPRGWILPRTNPDRGALRRLVESLLLGGVELDVADEAFTADGREWPEGSIVIRRDQPYGQHVKDLFEIQRYPEGEPPYDVAGWSLPLLLGVRRVEVMEDIRAPLRRVTDAEDAVSAIDSGVSEDRADPRDSDAWVEVFRRLQAGEAVAYHHRKGGQPGEEAWFALGSSSSDAASEEETVQVISKLPRIGLLSPWRGNMDEGWARYVLDSFGVPFVTVRNEMVRAGELHEFLDVLVIASQSSGELDHGRGLGSVPSEFVGGLAPEGASAIEAFVRDGGRLVAVGRSAEWAIELLDLPLEDVTRGEQAGEFSCPGSILRSVPEESALTAGLPSTLPVFFSHSTGWRRSDAKEDKQDGDQDGDDERSFDVLLRYAPTRLLLSGWIREPDTLAGQAAWIRADHGQGSVHLFGFRPQYRGWSQASFQLLFRAVLLNG